MISGETDDKTAAAAYVKNYMDIKKSYSEIVFINGSWDDRLYIENYGCGIEMKCKIYDCTGNLTEKTHVLLKNGTNSFAYRSRELCCCQKPRKVKLYKSCKAIFSGEKQLKRENGFCD